MGKQFAIDKNRVVKQLHKLRDTIAEDNAEAHEIIGDMLLQFANAIMEEYFEDKYEIEDIKSDEK